MIYFTFPGFIFLLRHLQETITATEIPVKVNIIVSTTISIIFLELAIESFATTAG